MIDYSTNLVRFLGLISYPDPTLILSLVGVQSLIQSDSPMVAILKFAVSSWCEAGNREIFGVARVSSYLTRQTIISSESFPTVLDHPIYLGSRGLSLKSPGNFSGAESCFVFSAFTFKIRVSSIILKIIK